MAVSVTLTGDMLVVDETQGLQNAYATPTVTGDANDSDIALARLPAYFVSRLESYNLTLDEAALSGYGTAGSNAGADTGSNIVTVTGDTGGNVNGLSLTATSGGASFPAYGGTASTYSSGLYTAEGSEIYLYSDPTDNNIVYGVAGALSDGEIIFALYLQEVQDGSGNIVGAKIWSVLTDGNTIGHLEDGDTTALHDDALNLQNKLFVTASGDASFSFAGAPAGNNLFMWFGTLDLAIVVTGRDPANQSAGESLPSGDTVNTSGQTATSLGTNGQQVKAGEGMYFTYVTGSTSTPAGEYLVPSLDQNEADVEANITFSDVADAHGGAFTISQVNPGSVDTTVSIKLTAFTTDAEPGAAFIDGYDDDQAVTITSVTINGVAASWSIDGDGVIVTGVKSGDVVGFTTSGEHQRLLVENAQPTSGKGSNISFDLGGFSLLQSGAVTAEVGSKVFFEDDGPSTTVDDLVGVFGAGVQTGVWSEAAGSDKFKSLNITLDDYTIGANATVDVDASLGTVSIPDNNGNYVFNGSITADFTDDGIANPKTVNFTLTFDPDEDSYDFQMSSPPTTVTVFDTSQGSLKAGAPDGIRTMLFGGSEGGDDDIVFFGVVPTAPTHDEAGGNDDLLDLIVEGDTDLAESGIEALLPLPDLLTSSTKMNVSTAGIGIENNNLNGADEGGGTGVFAGTSITDGDQSFVVNPEADVDIVRVYISSTLQGYDPANEDLYYTVYYDTGDVSAPIRVLASDLTHIASGDKNFPKEVRGGSYFEIDGGAAGIDAVQLTMGKGEVKIPIIAFIQEEVFDPEPTSINFTATLYDNDDDFTTDEFSIDLGYTLV